MRHGVLLRISRLIHGRGCAAVACRDTLVGRASGVRAPSGNRAKASEPIQKMPAGDGCAGAASVVAGPARA